MAESSVVEAFSANKRAVVVELVNIEFVPVRLVIHALLMVAPVAESCDVDAYCVVKFVVDAVIAEKSVAVVVASVVVPVTVNVPVTSWFPEYVVVPMKAVSR